MVNYQVTVHKGNNCIVRIHKPILTEEERKIREERIKAALVQYGREVFRK
jgi:hypothetical protein